jgi:predicted RNA binding protein YcfA (HicA-like mRNA interferase family)
MSERLPVLSGKELIRILERQGWSVRRQTGSHIIMFRNEGEQTLTVPNHRT